MPQKLLIGTDFNQVPTNGMLGTLAFQNADAIHPLGLGLGTAALPSLYITGDRNTGLYSPGADQLAISTAGVQRLLIDSNGQVEIKSLGTALLPALAFVDDPNTGLFSPSADILSLSTAGAERVRIDNFGRILIGTTAVASVPAGDGAVYQPSVQLSSISYAGSTLSAMLFNTAANGGGTLQLGRSNTTTINGHATAVNNDVAGSIFFTASDGATHLRAARIGGEIDGTPGTGSMPGRIVFSTSADGSSSPSERLRIDNQGRIGIAGAADPADRVTVRVTAASSGYSNGIVWRGSVNANTTIQHVSFGSLAYASAGSYTVPSFNHFSASQPGAFGAGATITTQRGFFASGLTGATNNYGFVSNIDAGTNRWNFYGAGTADSYFASNNFIFANGGSEKARFDSSGRLLIGISTARQAGVTRVLQVEGTDAGTSSASIIRNTNDTFGATINLGKSRGTTTGSNAIVQSNDVIGAIQYYGANGTDINSVVGAILCESDGTPSSTSMPGRLILQTTASGALFPTERLRIDSTGRVLIGTTTNTNSSALVVNGTISETVNGVQHLVVSSADIGTAPNQIPLNGYLGSMAFQDATAISAGIAAITGAGTDSIPGLQVTGAWFTGGTTTTTKPQLLLEPFGTTSTAWSTSGTGLGINAASGFTGRLLDAQVNGTSVFNISATGRLSIPLGTAALPSIYPGTDTDTGIYSPGANRIGFSTAGVAACEIDATGNLVAYKDVNLSDGASFTTTLQTVTATANRTISFPDASGTVALVAGASGQLTYNLSGAQAGDANLLWNSTTGLEVGKPLTVKIDSVERFRISNEGIQTYAQVAPAAVDATATLSIDNLKTGIITSTTASPVTMTLPTGTLTEAGFINVYANMTFEWSVVNTGATNAVTVNDGTGHTLIGSRTVAAGTSARFASRRTAANTFVSYRLC
jgi:hypothetical protein